MAENGYKTANVIAPKSCIFYECLELFKITNKISNYISKAMENGKMELTEGMRKLAEVNVHGSLFKRYPLLSLQFFYSN